MLINRKVVKKYKIGRRRKKICGAVSWGQGFESSNGHSGDDYLSLVIAIGFCARCFATKTRLPLITVSLVLTIIGKKL